MEDTLNHLLTQLLDKEDLGDNRIGLYIFGAGQGGEVLLKYLKENSCITNISYDLKGFFDNDTLKHGANIDGMTITAPRKDIVASKDFIIVSSVNSYEEIKRQLLKLGIEEKKILCADDWLAIGNQNIISKYKTELKYIDDNISNTEEKYIPFLFKEIPIEVFGQLSLQEQDQYKNIKIFFPLMASEEIQRRWTGSHDSVLMSQSSAFIKTVVEFCQYQGLQDLNKCNLLDFGCGWGRLIRLLYKYIPANQIYGVDAWKVSLDVCNEHQVKGNFAQIKDICTSIPFDVDFDLVISFSVFTHLSPRAGIAALNTIRRYIKNNGILALTVRPIEYWQIHKKLIDSTISIDELIQTHNKNGVAFVPHNLPPVDGDITFGDITISLDYIKDHWKQWKLIEYITNKEDPYQMILFFKPS